MSVDLLPAAVVAAYELSSPRVRVLPGGNINQTFRVDGDGDPLVMQRLNPIFAPEINHNIAALTAHLSAAGLRTPRLRRNRAGQLWTLDERGDVWRAMTLIAGVTHQRAANAAMCRSAGSLVGRFHAALVDFETPLVGARLGVHDTARHLAHLREALARHPQHPARADVDRRAGELFAAIDGPRSLVGLPERVVHGDLKLSNIVFSDAGEALCLIDLDTINTMPLPIELGDALRSWCNPAGEADADSHFDMSYFVASLEGIASTGGGVISAPEWAAVPTATLTIALELASRFLADALDESYFAWDSDRYAAAWQHNLVRADSQLALARSIAEQMDEAQRCVGSMGSG